MKASSSNTNGPEIRRMLEEVGLTETETHIYLAGLGSDVVTVQELLAETGIKRPTIYHALHTLGEKGLVTECEYAGKSGFMMQAPAKLLGWLDAQKGALAQKEDAVQALIRQLATRAAPSGESGMQITTYADMKSMQAIFDLAFYARSKKCVMVIPSKDLLKEFDADGTRAADAALRGVDVQVLVRRGIDSALIQYDENVVIITLLPHRTMTVITSPSLSSILSALF